MTIRRLLQPLQSWLSRVWPGKSPSEKQSAPTADESSKPIPSANTAIFVKKPSNSPSQGFRAGLPRVNDQDELQDLIAEAVNRAMHALNARGRLLDSDQIVQMALRINEEARHEKNWGRYQVAEALIQRALDIFDKIVVPDDPRLPDILDNYADLLRRVDREPDAISFEARAASIRALWPPDQAPDTRIKAR
jgi:hypothetical protein